MPGDTLPLPQFRPVAERAVRVEFADQISEAAHQAVLSLDAQLAAAPFEGFVESVPAYVNLLVEFDCRVTDHAQVIAALKRQIGKGAMGQRPGQIRVVDVCYDTELGPDLAEVAHRAALSQDAVIAAHLAGDYRVFMDGFAPGYAYLGGLSDRLSLDRKPKPVRGVAKGSVIIAGRQCLVTTLVMPTGWWIIGRAPTQILTDDPVKPFLFDVGDQVRFRRISRAEYDRLAK